MRPTIAVLAAVVTALVAAGPTARIAASTGPIPLNCDRACLEGVMNQYLAAVVAHDPKRVPLSEDVMYTENDLRRLAYNEEISLESCGLTRDDVVLLTCTMDRCFIAGVLFATGFICLRDLQAF